MTNDLQTAIERCRQHSTNLGNVAIADRNIIVAAYLRDTLADDHLPVTKEWLLSIGAKEGGSPLARPLYIDCVTFDDVARGVVSICDWSENAVLGKHFTTRGAVRRLLAALGIRSTS